MVQTIIYLKSLSIEIHSNNIYIPEVGAVVTAEAAATVAAWVTAGLILYTVRFLSYTFFFIYIQKTITPFCTSVLEF